MTNPRTALPAPVPSHPPEKGRRVPVNPLLPGFFPDPSVCRAGDRYYVANSTFEYFPGLPLHVSDDLETWTSIGAAINRAGPTDFSAMADSKGLYAPTIRQIRPLPAGITNRVGRSRRTSMAPNILRRAGHLYLCRRWLRPLRVGPQTPSAMMVDQSRRWVSP